MYLLFTSNRCGRDSMDLQLPVQSMPITTYIVHCEFKSLSRLSVLNTILCDGDLCKIGGFCQLFQFPLPVKLTHHDITEIFLKVTLNTILP